MTEPIPCKHCGKPTDYSGTELCDLCWSVDRRVRLNPKLALKVLDEMGLTPKSEADELLEWAENHPEPVIHTIKSWWSMAGKGLREEWFNFRGAIEETREASDE